MTALRETAFNDAELQEGSVVKDSLTTAADGKSYQAKLYRLDAALMHMSQAISNSGGGV